MKRIVLCGSRKFKDKILKLGEEIREKGYEVVVPREFLVEMNKRDQELLVDKHNESLKVMPVLFDQNDYNVTVCDAPYANYKWIPDLSIYDEYPEIDKYITKGYFTSKENKQQNIHYATSPWSSPSGRINIPIPAPTRVETISDQLGSINC